MRRSAIAILRDSRIIEANERRPCKKTRVTREMRRGTREEVLRAGTRGIFE